MWICKTPKCNNTEYEEVDKVYIRCKKCGQLFVKVIKNGKNNI